MPRTRRQTEIRERKKNYSRIKGRKRKISTSSEEDDEPWNTSFAVHETPTGEAEEFLCPYFDGAKLILPPGYEHFKKKVEKKEGKSALNSSENSTRGPDGAPLRRSSRATKSKKRMYIYSDEDSSSGFEDSKLSSAIASGTPIPTCMFVNAGVAGGSGIDVNKDVFKSLPQTKGQIVSASADDEKLEFTIEINESSDDEDTEDCAPKTIIVFPAGDTGQSNINGLDQAKEGNTEPDVKLKDDPIFLSDEEVTSNKSSKNGKDSEQGKEITPSQSNIGESESPNQETSLENIDTTETVELKVSVSNGSEINSCTSVDKADNKSSQELKSTESAATETTVKEVDEEMDTPKERFNSRDSGNESSTDNKEEIPDKDPSHDLDDNSSKPIDCKQASESQAEGSVALDMEGSNSFKVDLLNEKSTGNSNIEDGRELCDESTVSEDEDKDSEITVSTHLTSVLPKEDGNSVETEEYKSEKADSEKTEDFEPEPEHALISEIKEKMKEYCSQRVEFAQTLYISGNLAITADNENPIRGSIGQNIRNEDTITVDNPVPTVCVPQELSNLVQKFCKEKLQYSVELLIQGEIHATIDGTLVSTICNFSFEPEEDDF